MSRFAIAVLWFGLLLNAGCAKPPISNVPTEIFTLAITTSTQDSGLLDMLVPMFRKQSGIDVRVIAVGTGQALELGRRGDADVVLTGSTTNQVRADFLRHFSDVQCWHSGVVSDGIQRQGHRLQALLGSQRPRNTPTSDPPMAYQSRAGVSRPELLFLSIHWTSEKCL